MNVGETELRTLYRELGVDTADNWDLPKLTAKTNQEGGIGRFHDTQFPIKDTASQELLDKITAEIANGGLVEVTPEPQAEAPSKAAKPKAAKPPAKKPVVVTKKKPVAKPKPKAPAKKPAVVVTKKKPAKTPAKKRGRPARDPNTAPTAETFGERMDKFRKKYGKTGAPVTKRAKLLSVVVRELQDAGRKKKALTKEDIHGVLKVEFQDRDPKGMWTYLANLVPSRMRDWYQIDVQGKRGEDGRFLYWIEPASKNQGKA